MILAKYLLRRFFTHVFLINIGLTLLYNLIEFFEKIIRIKHTTTETTLVFITLSIIPSFFENLPISTWLASCMTLKEMHQQNEWETLHLLNVPLKKIFSLIFVAGLTLMIFNFTGKELVTHQLAQTAEQFKQEQFKQNRSTKLFNQWFVLNNKTLFCYVRYLDIDANQGNELSLFELSDTFKIEKITSAKIFMINPQTKTIILPQSTTLLTHEKKQYTEQNKQIKLTSFFTQLRMKGESPPLKQIFHLVIFDYKTLPDYVYHQLLYLFLNRILIHLLLLLYPLLTFMLFFLFPLHRHYRWILILIPYPLTAVLFTITDSLMQTIQHGAIALLPYVILSLCTIGTYFSIRK